MAFDIDIHRRIGDRDFRCAFSVEGGLSAITGPSGVGKTSLLNMIAGLMTPDTGHIEVEGIRLFDSALGINIPTRERHAGYVFQDMRLFPHMRVEANLCYGAPRRRNDTMSSRTLEFDEVVGFLGIGHLLARWPSSLSGGEAQRVAIGRALLSGPRFLLMDEPLGALDHERRETIMALIENLRDRYGIPILYVSHDRQEVQRLASNIITL